MTDIPAVLNAKIAAENKYWLYINGSCVVREGGLLFEAESDAISILSDNSVVTVNGKTGETTEKILVI